MDNQIVLLTAIVTAALSLVALMLQLVNAVRFVRARREEARSQHFHGTIMQGPLSEEDLGRVAMRSIDSATESDLLPAVTNDRPKGSGFLVASDSGSVIRVGHKMSIGRAADSSIVVPGLLVSRLHAMLTIEGDAVYISDQASTNGTFVNGKKVTKHRLRDGDCISIGAIGLTYHSDGR